MHKTYIQGKAVGRKYMFNQYFAESANRSAKAYFGKVVKGQPYVYNTPFARGESTVALLNAWNKILAKIEKSWPSLYGFEMDMKSKVGPLSIQKPLRHRLNDIQQYYDGVLLPQTPISDDALSASIAEWKGPRGMWIRTKSNTIANMKLSSNSGTPYFTKRRNVQESGEHLDVKSESLSLTDDYINAAILGWRGQEGGMKDDDVKQRVVWMFPYSVNVAELQVYQPLIEIAQQWEIVPAWVSMECVDLHITKLFDSKGERDLVICTDFTKFDQHFNQTMQDGASFILQSIFNTSIKKWLHDVFPIKYRIPLLISDKVMITGPHGMGSGSGGTNADETLSHRALQHEAAILADEVLNPNSMCLGDDGILSYPNCTVKDVTQAYSSHGLEMNISKQYASDQDCVYLRRWHHTDYRINGACVGVYSTMRALGRLRYLERYMNPEIWGPKAVALRQLSILENVKYHPLRNEFVQFCMKRDKYRLGIDIPGFLDNIEDEVEKVVSVMPDFLGYTNTLQNESKHHFGIKEWWIFRYLKEISSNR